MASPQKRQGDVAALDVCSSPAKKRATTSTPYIEMADEFTGYPLDMFCIPQHYEDALKTVLIPHGMLMDRVEKLAQEISKDFPNEPLVCLCVLKGGHQFFADLMTYIKRTNSGGPHSVPLTIDFIRLKSYEGQESCGEVKIIGGDSLETLRGKNVLVVEDIIDTGKTMQKLLPVLKSHGPKSVSVASLFVKRTPRSSGYKPEYIGFEVSDHFIVGYALDYNEYFRDLDHVCILNDHGIKKYAEEEKH